MAPSAAPERWVSELALKLAPMAERFDAQGINLAIKEAAREHGWDAWKVTHAVGEEWQRQRIIPQRMGYA